jgi:hypothetical protein
MKDVILAVLVWVVLTIAGMILVFYLAVVLGRQARWAGLAVLPWHWRRGEVLCPNCLGNRDADVGLREEHRDCWFCLRSNHQHAQHTGQPYDSLGYVTWGYLWHEWDWWHWRQQPVPRPTRRPPARV